MLISRIEKGKGQRYLVYADTEFLFALYGKELKSYGIEEGKELEEGTADVIWNDVILKRSKERALYLLEQRMYTVSMMRQKLLDSDYPACIVERVLSFLERYHYLDDAVYVSMYVREYAEKKSKKQLSWDLYRKGVPKPVVDVFFEEHSYSDESCFERQFNRYVRGKDMREHSERQKVFRYFYGKGFSSGLICEHIRRLEVMQ